MSAKLSANSSESTSRAESRCIIPTLAYQLARNIPQTKMPIAHIVADDHWLFHLSLQEQIRKLLIAPLQSASDLYEKKQRCAPKLFLIHGLEDCDDEDPLDFLGAFMDGLRLMQHNVPQKLLVLGRRAAQLQECFSRPGVQENVYLRSLPVSRDEFE